MATKKNLILVSGVLLFALFLVICFAKRPFLSLFNEQKVAAYYSLLKGRNQDLRPKILSLGDEVSFKISFPHKSIEGKYALRNVRFIPDDDAHSPWEGKDKPREWSEHITGDMKHFKLSVSFLVPNNPELEGKTIEGDLMMEVIYPQEIKSSWGIIPGKFSNYSSRKSEHIFCHVFFLEQKMLLEHTKRWMDMIWITAMLVSGTCVSIFLSGFLGLQDSPQGSAIVLVPSAISLGAYAWFSIVRYLINLAEGVPFNFWTFLIGVPLVICILPFLIVLIVVVWSLLATIVQKGFGCLTEFK